MASASGASASGAPASGRRRQSTEQRRKEILDATLDALIETGESKTFIHEVCKRARVSVGTLYHHFGSKDQLIATLHYTVLNLYQEGAGGILAADPPAEQGIKETVDYHLRWLANHPREATFLLQQPFAGFRSDRVPAELTGTNEEFLGIVHSWLNRQMDAGHLRRLPFDTVVAQLIGPLHHWVRAQLFVAPDRAAERADRAASTLAEGAWQALRFTPPDDPPPRLRPGGR